MKVEVLYEKAPVSGAILRLDKDEIGQLKRILNLATTGIYSRHRDKWTSFGTSAEEIVDLKLVESFYKALP